MVNLLEGDCYGVDFGLITLFVLVARPKGVSYSPVLAAISTGCNDVLALPDFTVLLRPLLGGVP